MEKSLARETYGARSLLRGMFEGYFGILRTRTDVTFSTARNPTQNFFFLSDFTTDQIPCKVVPTVPVATVLTKLLSVAVASLLLEQNRIEDDESYCRA